MSSDVKDILNQSSCAESAVMELCGILEDGMSAAKELDKLMNTLAAELLFPSNRFMLHRQLTRDGMSHLSGILSCVS